MMSFGAIGFLQPWMLLGLAALPAIWWLLRLTPPTPQHVVFPPTRLLKDLKSTEETPAHSPWWITALRMLLAALIVLAPAVPISRDDALHCDPFHPTTWLTESSDVITDTIRPPTTMLIATMASGPMIPTIRSRLRCSLVS